VDAATALRNGERELAALAQAFRSAERRGAERDSPLSSRR